LLAGIFSGEIQRWNDKAIAALNPPLQLPYTRVIRVVRSDGSSTTGIFVRYLMQTRRPPPPPSRSKVLAPSGRAA
jgi:phosphate transport system substrate-binding protein